MSAMRMVSELIKGSISAGTASVAVRENAGEPSKCAIKLCEASLLDASTTA